MDGVRTNTGMSADGADNVDNVTTSAVNAGADADNVGIVRVMDTSAVSEPISADNTITSADNEPTSDDSDPGMGSSGGWTQAAGFCLQGVVLIFIIVIVLLTSSCGGGNADNATSYEVPSAPTLERPVRDETGTLTSEDIDRISSTIANNPDDPDSPQIAVLMVGSIPDGETVEEASLEVARAWGVGGEDRKNGVLFYVAKNDHEMRIEVADGVGEYLTDVESARILDDYAKPAFRDDRYADGINDSVGLIREEVGGEPGVSYAQGNTSNATASTSMNGSTVFIFILAIFIVVFYPMIRILIRHYTRHEDLPSSALGWFLSERSGWSRGSGDSSSSSGSSFGGGGGFSGGGASGKW